MNIKDLSNFELEQEKETILDALANELTWYPTRIGDNSPDSALETVYAEMHRRESGE